MFTAFELFLSDEVQSLIDHFAAVLDLRVTFFSADGRELRRGRHMRNSDYCAMVQQEIGTLTSMEPHISSRENLSSYLFLTVRRGEGYLTYRGKRHFIKAGDCVYINCRNQYAHESTAEHPWTLMWVHFSGNGADDFYKTYQEQERSSIFHPPDTSPFTDSLTALYSLMHEKPSLMELYAHRYLTDLITLCFTGGRPEAGRPDEALGYRPGGLKLQGNCKRALRGDQRGRLLRQGSLCPGA